jgi:hypothetical protein
VYRCQPMLLQEQTGVRWIRPVPGKISVACDQADSGQTGLVSRDRNAKAWPDSRCCRLVRFTYRIE